MGVSFEIVRKNTINYGERIPLAEIDMQKLGNEILKSLYGLRVDGSVFDGNFLARHDYMRKKMAEGVTPEDALIWFPIIEGEGIRRIVRLLGEKYGLRRDILYPSGANARRLDYYLYFNDKAQCEIKFHLNDFEDLNMPFDIKEIYFKYFAFK